MNRTFVVSSRVSGSLGAFWVIKVGYVLAAISPPERLSRGLHPVGYLIALFFPIRRCGPERAGSAVGGT